MVRTSTTGLLVCAIAVLCPPSLRAAEEAAKQGEVRVVLIGVSDYADKAIKPRKHAEHDVKALYDLFTNKDYLGVKADNVRLLVGTADEKRKSSPASRDNILKAVEWLASESKRDDVALFAFVGEGAPLGEKSERRCYLASDTIFKDRGKTAVAAADIEERLNKLKSRKFVAFVDVDFKGYIDKTVVDPVLGGAPYREFLGDDNSDEHNFIPGRTLFLATNGLSASIDLKEQGLMTHVLLGGLKGEADKEGYEPDGHITIAELADYFTKTMPVLAREHGKPPDEKAQRQIVLGERTDASALTTNPAVIAKVRERLKALDKLIADKKIPEKLVDEARKLLDQMPRLKAQQNLRKAYAELIDGKLTPEKFEKQRDDILASTKLNREAADSFADDVLRATELLMRGYVKELNRGELIGGAIRGIYRRLGEKPSAGLTEKLTGVKKMTVDELKSLLAEARMELGKREDLDGRKDVDMALQRLFGHLNDTYSTYIDPATVEEFNKRMGGRFVGIGVQIRKDKATDYLLVITPMKDGPAHKAGIQAGDLITKVTLFVDREGKELEKPKEVETKGLDVNDAVKQITGKAGTKVKVTIQRPTDGNKVQEFELTRGKIEAETVMGVRRKDNAKWDFMLDNEKKIGYIRLTQFNPTSTKEMNDALNELRKAGVRALIFDLRFNPGGSLGTARDISDMFIDDGLIVSVRPRRGEEEKIPGFVNEDESRVHLRYPMVCLINGQSPSGSEILSAALQDHNRALLIGERSYGKGSVQSVAPFGGGEIKMTTASFWRPSGRNINKPDTKGREEDDWGVKPDIVVKLTAKEVDELEEAQKESETIHAKGTPPKKSEFKDRQVEKSIEYLKEQIKLADKVKNRRAIDD